MRLGVDIVQTHLQPNHGQSRRPHLARHGRYGTRNHRGRLRKAVPYGVWHTCLDEELLDLRIELRAPDAEEAQASAEDLHQTAAHYTVDLPTQEIVAVDLAKEGVGGKLGIYLTAVDLLDYERHDQQTRRPHRLQRRQQNRSRRRLLEVCDPAPDSKGIEHADRTLVCVRQGQHREHRVILVDGEQAVHHVDVRGQIVMSEHHALGPRHRTRRIYYDGQIIGTRHGTLPGPLRTLRYDTEILRTDDDVEHRHRLLRQLGKQFGRYEERLGLRMAYEHVELRLGEVGKDRHRDHACRRDGEIADTPVGHVAAQYRHLVAGAQTGIEQHLLYYGHSQPDLGISHILAPEHREGDVVLILFYAVFKKFIECI